MLIGRYSFKFSGYAVPNGAPWHIAGTGWFELKPKFTFPQGKPPEDGTLVGEQIATVMALTGSQMNMETTTSSLSGTYAVSKTASGLWSASIKFVSPVEELIGTFAVTDAGNGDRLFLVTTATEIELPGGPQQVPEMVSGEAVRVSF